MKSKHRSPIESLEARRLFAAGELDTTFGNGGVVITDILNDGIGDHASQVFPMADGRVVTIGSTTLPDPTFTRLWPMHRVIITRHLANGTPDNTFDGDGVAIYEQADHDAFTPSAAVVNPDGSIILVGSAVTGVEEGPDLILRPVGETRTLRITPNGQVDSSFNGAAISSGFGGHLMRLSDGKLLASGSRTVSPGEFVGVVRRFNSNGALDTTFGGGDGVVDSPSPSSWIRRLDVRSDGKIFVTSGDNAATDFVTQFNADGTLDTSAGGGDGVIELDDTLWQFGPVIPAPGGGFLAAAWIERNPLPLSLVKLTSSGAIDPTFSNGAMPAVVDILNAELIVQDDGKILVAGTTEDDRDSGFRRDPIVARFSATGTRDTSFGENGAYRLRTTLENNSTLKDAALSISPTGTLYAAGAGSGQHMLFRMDVGPTNTGQPDTASVDLTDDGTLTIVGTAGRDVFTAYSFEDRLPPGNTIELEVNFGIHSIPHRDVRQIVILGGAGDDYIDLRDVHRIGRVSTPPVTIDGGAGNDVLVGHQGDDRITGGADNDRVYGWMGDDSLSGNAQSDRIDGGEGNDVILGNGGRDYLAGSQGNDSLHGGDQPDVLAGGDGDDLLEGQGGHDRLIGDAGNDTLSGAGGNDTFFARDGFADSIIGGLAGADIALVDQEEDDVVGVEDLL